MVCRTVYGSILGGHLEATDFEAPIKRLGTTLITAALDLHAAVANAFLPSAVKFHYQFNLRELSTITEVRFAPRYMVADGRLPDNQAAGKELPDATSCCQVLLSDSCVVRGTPSLTRSCTTKTSTMQLHAASCI